MSHLMSAGNDINKFFFKKSQMPDRWFYKAYRLYKDANILYEIFEKERVLIYEKLEQKSFLKSSDMRGLTSYMYAIQEENSDVDIPDYRSFYLLAGFCIENALKGIIVSQNIEIIDSEKLSAKLKQHNLNKLVKMTNLNLNDEQLVFLEELSDLIVNYGRYPIRVACPNAEEAGKFDSGDIDYFQASCNCITNPYKGDKAIFSSIYEKLENLMTEENKKYDEQMNFIFKEEMQ